MELPVPPKFVEALKNISADEGAQVVFQGVVDGECRNVVQMTGTRGVSYGTPSWVFYH